MTRSASQRPLHSCCYIQLDLQQGSTGATGFLARVENQYFVLSTHTMLPNAASCRKAYAIFHYNQPSAVRVTLDPRLTFLTSPAGELDFTLVALSLDSQHQLPMQSILPFAYDLSEHVSRDKIARFTTCKQYEFRLHSCLHVSAGYVLSLYSGWMSFSDAALESSSGGGLMVGGENDEVLGFHRSWNASRCWNEGTLIADIVPEINAYLASFRQDGTSATWLRSRLMYITSTMSALF
jgi:hypothetical protein